MGPPQQGHGSRKVSGLIPAVACGAASGRAALSEVRIFAMLDLRAAQASRPYWRMRWKPRADLGHCGVCTEEYQLSRTMEVKQPVEEQPAQEPRQDLRMQEKPGTAGDPADATGRQATA